MKEKLLANLKKQTRQSLGLTMMAGAYLIYLAWSLLKSFRESGSILPLAFALLFVLIGGVMIALPGWALSAGVYRGGPKKPEAPRETAEEETDHQ